MNASSWKVWNRAMICFAIALLFAGISCQRGEETPAVPAGSQPAKSSAAAPAFAPSPAPTSTPPNANAAAKANVKNAGKVEPPATGDVCRPGANVGAGVGAKAGVSEEIQSLSVNVGGNRIHYLMSGPAEGRPVLLLHGANYEAKTWKETGTLALLAREGYRAYALDFPGSGGSLPAEVNEETWLFDVLGALDLKKPVVVSPSMSGLYSLPLEIAAPPRTSGYVAVAPIAIPKYKTKLKRIVVPVLAVWGEKDKQVPREYQNLLAETVPEGRKATIPNAGHACYLDNPEGFHRELLAFLQGLPPVNYQD